MSIRMTSLLVLLLCLPGWAANDFSRDGNVVMLQTFDSAGDTTIYDGAGYNDMTEVGTTDVNTADFKEGTGSLQIDAANNEGYVRTGETISVIFPGKSGTSNTTWSMCCWFKLKSDTGDDQTFASKWYNAAGNRAWKVNANATTDTINLSIMGASPETFTMSSAGLSTGVWFHVGATYNSSTKAWAIYRYNASTTAYKSSSGTGSETAVVGASGEDVYVGRAMHASFIWPLDGLIDEVVIFDDVLTASEVNDIRDGVYAVNDIAVSTFYVDPDATGAEDGTSWTDAYQSLDEFQAAKATDLVTAGAEYLLYCRSSADTNDTNAVTITGWEMDPIRHLEIIGNDFPADGIYDSTKYVKEVGNGVTGVTVSEPAIEFQNLQFEVTTTSGNSLGISYTGASPGTSYIDSCIFRGVCSGGGSGRALLINDTGNNVEVWNTTIYGFISGVDAQFDGVLMQQGVNVFYNCTVWGNRIALNRSGGTANAYNVIAGNNTDDFWSVTCDYCLSDDGDGTNTQSPSGGSWANELVDPNNGDFTLVVGGNAINNGTADPSGGLFSDDIIGTERVAPWDIGAFEVAVSGAQIMWLQLED